MPTAVGPRLLRNLIGIAIAIVGMALFAAGAAVWELRADAITRAERDNGNLATIFADQMGQSVKAIDSGLLEIRERLVAIHNASPETYAEAIRSGAVFRMLGDLEKRLPDSDVIAVLSADGHLVNHSRGWPAPSIDLSDREHFAAEQTADAGMHVGLPVVSRVNQESLMLFSRRVDSSAGEFLGVVEVGLRANYFEHIYRSIGALPGQSLLFLRSDGTVLTRYPDPKQRTGEKMPQRSRWFEVVAKGGGTYRSPGYFDRDALIVAVRNVPGYPLVVDVAVTESASLAVWERRATMIAIGAILTLVCIGLLLRALVLQFRKLAERESRLSEKSRALEGANRTIDAALNNMSQGLCMVDKDGRILICNERYQRIYGLPSDIVAPGARMTDILAYRKQHGNFDGDPVAFVAQLLIGIKEGQKVYSRAELADGRLIAVVNEPMSGGGWVATHDDITERERLERRTAEQAEQLRQREEELRVQNMRFKAAIDNMGEGLCMFDAEEKLVVWNQRFINLFNFPPNLFKVGMPYREIVAYRITSGMTAAPLDDLAVEQRIEALRGFSRDKSSSRIEELSDARLIRIFRQPLEEGGWVDTHEDVTDRHRHEAKISFMAHHDLLTGLANRAFFTEKIEEAVARLRRHGDSFAILMLDLDRFKNVNDTLGHPAGDQLLRDTAQRLKSSLRDTDVLARLGGDEFAVIQSSHNHPREDASSLAARMVRVISQPYDIDGNIVSIGASIGIAIAPDHANESTDLLKMADLALYAIKSAGRNGFRFFDPTMLADTDNRRRLESELRSAISNGEFVLHYQALVDARTRRQAGFEALVRWRHPTRGLVMPDEFIPLAEETGLIVPLGAWILQKACEDAAKWPSHLKVSVNLSTVQLAQPDLLQVVLCALAESSLAPERLELEITETALFEGDVDCVTLIRKLKKLGVTIALDDFDTGYSSLSYLTMFPFDRIKIDRSFTSNLESRADCAAIVSAVLALGHSLDRETVAEGVETEEQFVILRAAGVTFVQGFLFGYPRPASELVLDKPANEIVESAA